MIQSTTLTPPGARPSPLAPPGPGSLCGGRFEDLVEVGEGGYARVYRATDTRYGGRVAVKVLNLWGLLEQDRAIAWHTWRRERDLLGAIAHPDIPGLLDAGFEGALYYLVMDFIEGIPLLDYLHQVSLRGVSLQEVLDLGLWLCEVLEYLHTQEPAPIIHCDIKPENVLLRTEREGYALVDFGTGRRYGRGDHDAACAAWDGALGDFDLATLGSPGYGAPEQYQGIARPSPLSDLYGMGALFRHMLSGVGPRRWRSEVKPLSVPGSPPGSAVIDLITALMQKDPAQRPQSAAAVAQTLRGAQEEAEKGFASSNGAPSPSRGSVHHRGEDRCSTREGRSRG